jgi:hypothetical protein
MWGYDEEQVGGQDFGAGSDGAGEDAEGEA